MGVQQMRENFEAQFEVAGETGYLYRHNQKGEAIPVTAEDRDRFISQYVRRIRLILGSMMVVLLGFFGVVVWRAVATDSELSDVLIYVGIGAITVVAIGLMYWVRGAPARELQGRTPIAGERSTEEMQAILFKKISYPQLAGVALMGAILPFTLRSHPDVFHGWARLWLLFGAVIVVVAAVQAFRKWRFETDHPNDVL